MARPKIDLIDKKILSVLHREGRITKTKMSDHVGLSATRCWERMQALEKAGIIRGYHADVDLRRLARLSLFQVHVRLFDTSPAKARQFEHFISRVDEVISCQAVLGSVDYILMVVASDVESFQATMDEISIRDTSKFDFVTYPIAKNVKSPQSVSLLALMDLADAQWNDTAD